LRRAGFRLGGFGDYDVAGVALQVLETDDYAGPIAAQREAFRPFDDYDGWFGEGIFQGESFDVVEVFAAVEIDVVDLGIGRRIAWSAIYRFENVYQGECGAGNIFFGCGAESADDSFGHCGFAAAEVTGEKD
jgi:hypothetical protein